MNIKSASLVATLLILSVNVNAEIQAISGTGVLYDPAGNPVGVPTPITGEYDTDAQQIIIDPWIFLGQL